MESLSYGTLPPLEEFKTSVEERNEWPADGYPMKLNSSDFIHVQTAVNQGIDSHLEAVAFTQDDARIVITDVGSMHTLLRRLLEDGSEEAQDLASSIMFTLGFEWI